LTTAKRATKAMAINAALARKCVIMLGSEPNQMIALI
jgi:hypothetical protein